MVDEKFLEEFRKLKFSMINEKFLDEIDKLKFSLDKFSNGELCFIARKVDKAIIEALGQFPDEFLLRAAMEDLLSVSQLGEIPHRGLAEYAHEVLISKKPKLWQTITGRLQKEDLDKAKELFYSIYLLVAEEAEQ